VNRLDNKTALITGAGSGLGEATARCFHAEGASLLLTDIQEVAVEEVAESLPGSIAMHHDVADETDWQAVVDTARSQLGRLDILVNNAGIFRLNPLTEMSLEEYRRVIDINQVGVFIGMKSAAPLMIDNGGGAIVNISSTQGMEGLIGGSAYVASKFAVRGMTKVAALELGRHDIRVNSVHPGGMATPMVFDAVEEETIDTVLEGQPIARFADPAEVANLILFLASDEASYCTGAEYLADGGMLAGPPFDV